MKHFDVKRFGVPEKDGGIKDVFGVSPNMELQYNRGTVFDPLDFNPHNYWDSDNLTVVSTTTTFLDYILEHDLVNPAASGQPTLNATDANFNGKPSLTFDGVANNMYKAVSGYRSADSSGEVHIVVNGVDATVGLSSSDEAGLNRYSMFGWVTTQYMQQKNDVVATNTIVDSIPTNLLGSTHLISIVSIGASYRIFLDGVEKTVNATSGSDDGSWFDNISFRDNIVIGALIRSSSSFRELDWAATGVFPLLSDADRVLLMNGLKTRYGIS